VEKTIVASITDFFKFGVPYKNSDLAQEFFLEDLILYITKGYRPLSSIENVWLRRLVLCQCGPITFLSKQKFSNEVILSMVNKTMECHVLPTFVDVITVTTTFDLWTS
jgi:hypothetical protein